MSEELRTAMKLDRKYLPGFVSTQKKEGLYAEFHPDGTLAHLGDYRDGELRGWALYAEDGAPRGHVEKKESYPFPDPDEDEGTEEEFVRWAEHWISEIVADASSARRCSFCGKADTDVRRLIAGPTSYICDECVGLCNSILKDVEQRDPRKC
jgi:hypothetical protein